MLLFPMGWYTSLPTVKTIKSYNYTDTAELFVETGGNKPPTMIHLCSHFLFRSGEKETEPIHSNRLPTPPLPCVPLGLHGYGLMKAFIMKVRETQPENFGHVPVSPLAFRSRFQARIIMPPNLVFAVQLQPFFRNLLLLYRKGVCI